MGVSQMCLGDGLGNGIMLGLCMWNTHAAPKLLS